MTPPLHTLNRYPGRLKALRPDNVRSSWSGCGETAVLDSMRQGRFAGYHHPGTLHPVTS